MTTADGQYKKKVRDSLKEREHLAILKHKYDTRISNVKIGKNAFQKGDFLTAIRRYTEYLEVVAEVKKIPSIYELHPNHFDKSNDVTEMLMISNLYFELAKVYDATGKFDEDLSKCLEQFVLFSANQPFQVVNSEMCRKHLRKFRFKNHDLFFQAYKQIFIKSRKCYIATHCFGEDHYHTQNLRAFRSFLISHPAGESFVRVYYSLSPKLVRLFDRHPLLSQTLTPLMKSGLTVFSRLLEGHIINR